MTNEFVEERQEVLDAVQRIVAMGLVSGASGNVSRRIVTTAGNLFAVTASRVPYHRFGIDDVLVVDADIDPVVGDGVPSSESLAHMAVYHARGDVGAVIHTHSVHASAFAVAGVAIPCILDEQVVSIGGAVEVAEYGASASEDLAGHAVAALGERSAVLLRHHGVLVAGVDLDDAVAVADLVERVARIRLLSLRLGEGARLPDEIVRVEQQMYRMMKGLKG